MRLPFSPSSGLYTASSLPGSRLHCEPVTFMVWIYVLPSFTDLDGPGVLLLFTWGFVASLVNLLCISNCAIPADTHTRIKIRIEPATDAIASPIKSTIYRFGFIEELCRCRFRNCTCVSCPPPPSVVSVLYVYLSVCCIGNWYDFRGVPFVSLFVHLLPAFIMYRSVSFNSANHRLADAGCIRIFDDGFVMRSFDV